ncbi:MAG: amidohydrolase [Bacteroidales bacterium]|nr:amidohydrolase [Bacteroidales bacterium]MDD4491917.1 amidohydrolase [Bacteroidales bacterium]
MKKIFFGLFLASILFSCNMKERADLIFINGDIYTVDSAFTKCNALAVKDGIIIATGGDDEILNAYQSKNIIDLEGKPLYPGFNDAHCHIAGLGMSLTRVDLRGATSFDEILSRLKKRQEENPAKCLLGDGWDQNLWEDKNFPSNEKLNELFPDVPVILSRIDFHAVIVNDEAIKRLGITPGDPSIIPGEALMKNGKFQGVFLENLADRFKEIVPKPDGKEMREILLAAQDECFKYGLTSLSDAGEELDMINVMDSMQGEGKLKIRLDVWLTPGERNFAKFSKPYKNERLSISAIKLYADGALGSRGALMIEPYSDMPNTRGISVNTVQKLEEYCKWAFDHGFQVATHCIGDGANREALRIYAKFLPEGNNLRWRIEHSQIVKPADMAMFGKYSIIPSIQPTHATSDMLWADERLGERIIYAYPYKELLNELGWLPAGTDFPIEQVNPVYTFFAAVYRKNLDFIPEGGFQMENALSKEEALKAMTIWAAKASFEEGAKGSIEKGKFADFVVLDKDIMTASEKEVPFIKVLRTFVGGEEVYKAE